jgi:transcriptional regulator with XRE-family HTH domain
VDLKSLARSRLILLMEALREEHDLQSDRQVAMAVGLDPSYAQRLREGVTQPGLDQISKVCAKVGLPAAFFTDPTLGDAPDYRDFVGRRETRVEREDERHPVVEAFITEQRLDQTEADDLRRQVRAWGGRFVRDELLLLLPAIRMRAARLKAEAAGEPTAPRELPPVPEGRRRVTGGKQGR